MIARSTAAYHRSLIAFEYVSEWRYGDSSLLSLPWIISGNLEIDPLVDGGASGELGLLLDLWKVRSILRS